VATAPLTGSMAHIITSRSSVTTITSPNRCISTSKGSHSPSFYCFTGIAPLPVGWTAVCFGAAPEMRGAAATGEDGGNGRVTPAVVTLL
jgi:hypothetical protein